MTVSQGDDFLLWITLGIVVGGRLGFVLFYEPSYFWHNPAEIPALWHGGMAFHGGLPGRAPAPSESALRGVSRRHRALYYFAYRHTPLPRVDASGHGVRPVPCLLWSVPHPGRIRPRAPCRSSPRYRYPHARHRL